MNCDEFTNEMTDSPEIETETVTISKREYDRLKELEEIKKGLEQVKQIKVNNICIEHEKTADDINQIILHDYDNDLHFSMPIWPSLKTLTQIAEGFNRFEMFVKETTAKKSQVAEEE